ncbi:MAG: peptidylprolyl isomerase [Patescibacteria group bacterium]|nr:peptidylprolyl isomerase [Patescibacteria group bacterium]
MFSGEGTPDNKKLLLVAGGILGLLLIIIAVLTLVRNSSPAGQHAANQRQGIITQAPLEIFDSSYTSPQQGSYLDGGGDSGPTSTPLPTRPAAPRAGVIARVGEELIYNVDLNEEVASFPPSDDPEVREKLFQKMVDDSIILQGASREGLIRMNATVYNSAEKNYAKRIALVQDAKEKLIAAGDSYSGTVVALWFFNQRPGRVGYDQGKKIARQRITDLHSRVKSGAITMEQAGEELRRDSSLYQVDEAFRINAIYTFTSNVKAQFNYDPGFEKVMRGLKVGEISDVYLGKGTGGDGTTRDAVYKFGRVDKIITNRGYSTIEEWLEINRNEYPVTRYQ